MKRQNTAPDTQNQRNVLRIEVESKIWDDPVLPANSVNLRKSETSKLKITTVHELLTKKQMKTSLLWKIAYYPPRFLNSTYILLLLPIDSSHLGPQVPPTNGRPAYILRHNQVVAEFHYWVMWIHQNCTTHLSRPLTRLFRITRRVRRRREAHSIWLQCSTNRLIKYRWQISKTLNMNKTGHNTQIKNNV